ncbi:hypothetical protein I546_1008 [Mycobacterium kansasii 732]|nr:hypothetical protein I546_1008 [Mycobacterium kansasii 732]
MNPDELFEEARDYVEVVRRPTSRTAPTSTRTESAASNTRAAVAGARWVAYRVRR